MVVHDPNIWLMEGAARSHVAKQMEGDRLDRDVCHPGGHRGDSGNSGRAGSAICPTNANPGRRSEPIRGCRHTSRARWESRTQAGFKRTCPSHWPTGFPMRAWRSVPWCRFRSYLPTATSRSVCSLSSRTRTDREASRCRWGADERVVEVDENVRIFQVGKNETRRWPPKSCFLTHGRITIRSRCSGGTAWRKSRKSMSLGRKDFDQGPRIKPSTFSEEDLKKTRDSAKDGMGNHGVARFMEVTHGNVSPSFLGSHPQILRCFA